MISQVGNSWTEFEDGDDGMNSTDIITSSIEQQESSDTEFRSRVCDLGDWFLSDILVLVLVHYIKKKTCLDLLVVAITAAAMLANSPEIPKAPLITGHFD